MCRQAYVTWVRSIISSHSWYEYVRATQVQNKHFFVCVCMWGGKIKLTADTQEIWSIQSPTSKLVLLAIILRSLCRLQCAAHSDNGNSVHLKFRLSKKVKHLFETDFFFYSKSHYREAACSSLLWRLLMRLVNTDSSKPWVCTETCSKLKLIELNRKA